ncbi:MULTISPECIES: hypothetical protein [Gammaproteobacteria]|uniref:hypothetical protein n=1 Tax=Gammaproteobacteria TaxID=1236 RepID=UPI000DD029F8|nr:MULTISPECIES: hypothetical protein [Gammaproteobacteria]RTE86731.1 hypothetical protein DQX04_09290 [Aliidiomarina sp. B3213]TCZ90715.1 hypothetical protein EYQ95_07755 [Lysobacter sp. N42]
MKTFLTALLMTFSFGVLLTGCTTRDMYEAMRENRINECKTIMPGILRDECMEKQSRTYEQYKSDRERARRQGEAGEH